ncbi:DUF7779 domain-containing protein [Streptomyces chisholmiae]|uniref:DUF7779 domain-containing protein n=1 Tax=Streptomyces chisholmiae TaxID=3075540 RepID=UPI0028895B53|nr:NB-ARC domain-containing protein [Streptomyces sp. DSM 44915]
MRVSRTGDAHALDGGFANTGQFTVVQLRGSREPAALPFRVGLLPVRAQCFQHRAEERLLREGFDGADRPVRCQVITGMGGVGKTQLAAAYAGSAYRDGEVDLLVWATASSRAALIADYAQAGRELCRADPDNQWRAAEAFLAWLASGAASAACRWLVVLDDVSDPDDLRGLWPPEHPHGRTLVTTRRRDAALFGDGRRSLTVGRFTPGLARAYLAETLRAHGRTEPEDQLTSLAEDLDHLPLALSQAAAYLVDTGRTVAVYREMVAESRPLADTAPDRLPDDQLRPLHATWTLSVQRANELTPTGQALPMLELVAMLDPHGIPATVLSGRPAQRHLVAGGTERERAGPYDALRALHRLNLIDHDPDAPHRAVRVHRLVQHATRDAMSPERLRHCARVGADALWAAWPEVERDTALAQVLRASAHALRRRAEDALCGAEGVHRVLYRVGDSMGEAGLVEAATEHFGHLVHRARDRLGAYHPHTLAARHNHALWRGRGGDAHGAAAAFSGLVAARLRVHGPNDPESIAAWHAFTHWWGEAGHAADAAEAFGQLLAHARQVLVEHHPEVLAARQALARWLGEAGDPAAAARVAREVVEDRQKVQGRDHPDTLAARHHLASWYAAAGDARAAVAELAPLVELFREQQDAGTLNMRNNLAHWRGLAGDARSAVRELHQLVSDRTRLQRPDHADTLAARHNLAHWRGQAGDPHAAAADYTELIADRARVQGPDDPATREARRHLAYWRARCA